MSGFFVLFRAWGLGFRRSGYESLFGIRARRDLCSYK